ncbi:MAG: hypothetical protein LQ349_002365, partial [Xanthoria aureola]
MAILDTRCHADDWISRDLVERLGWQDKNKISQDYESPNLTDACTFKNKNSTPSKAAQKFEHGIKVADVHDNFKLAVAILDTGCHAGNWISRDLVERLGWQDKISQDYESPNLTDAGGHKVVACGSITLQWKWSPQGLVVYENDFYIFQESPNLDVVFGADFLDSKGLVSVNKQLMMPMIAHNKAPTSENAKIALALEKQKQEKATLETQRIQSQQQAGQQQGDPSSQAQQSGQQGPTQTQGRQRPRGYGIP